MTKTCSKCKEVKAITDFRKKSGRSNQTQSYCYPCDSEYHRQNHQKNRDKRLRQSSNTRLLRNFGVTLEWVELQITKQNGLCYLCGRPERIKRRLQVDHDHKTGKVRGIICWDCNVGLGKLNDSVESILKAACYLANKLGTDQELPTEAINFLFWLNSSAGEDFPVLQQKS